MASAASAPAYLLPGVAVCQPAHLEGDSAFATEILPGPPPLVSVQQPPQKRDAKHPIVYSYLPASDPGTTYSGITHGTLIGQDSIHAIGKRTRVDKSTVTGRAQRASARNQVAPSSQPDVAGPEPSGPPLVPYADSDSTMVVDDTPAPSRAASAQRTVEPPPQPQPQPPPPAANGRPRRKDKGKAKEPDALPAKDELAASPGPEPASALALANDDHCSSCRSQGSLVYCDGCPKAFHLWCLDPPIQKIDESDAKWFCPACNIRKNPPRKPPPSFISPLIHLVDTSIPTEYQLPTEIRNFYKDVATGDRGAYVDSSEIKQPRLNRLGALEDREPHRLKDKNGDPVLCFRCGTSAIPDNAAAAAPAAKRARRATAKPVQHDVWKNIISCDYCDLHWHLDCLDPPLPSMPPFTKKWMCPNHAEHVLPSRHRIPKQGAPVIEVTKPRQFNNGNIEILPSQNASSSQKKLNIEEILINGRRYRVPERIILLDFWTKLDKDANGSDMDVDDEDPSEVSSPLTSLSSLSDVEDHGSRSESPQSDDLSFAQMLCDFQRGTQSPVRASKKKSATTTPPVNSNLSEIDDKLRRLWPALKPPAQTASASAGPSTSTAKRKKSASQAHSDSTVRELRSRGSKHADQSASSSKSSSRLPEDLPASAPRKASHAKTEAVEENGVASTSSTGRSLGRANKRATRKPLPKEHETAMAEDTDKPKRGKKRKDRDEDNDYVAKGSAAAAAKNKGVGKRKSVRTPTVAPQSPGAGETSSPAAPPTVSPATPSLKIRLRLNPPSASASTSATADPSV